MQLSEIVEGQAPVPSGCHNVLGNRMRYERTGDREVVYDYGWMHSREWMLPAVLLPHVTSYNRTLFNLALADG